MMTYFLKNGNYKYCFFLAFGFLHDVRSKSAEDVSETTYCKVLNRVIYSALR
jgi:hypothetical protein